MDKNAKCYWTTKKSGPAWMAVQRRVTIDVGTGRVIQDLKIGHASRNNKILHKQLPGGQCNTKTILYHTDTALTDQNEPQSADHLEEDEVCMPGLQVTYPSNAQSNDDNDIPAIVSQDWDGPSQNIKVLKGIVLATIPQLAHSLRISPILIPT